MRIFQFKKARPVWAQDRAMEKNCELAFRTVLPRGGYKLFLAASSIYRIWVNGVFTAAGPARAPHGHYRVDEYSLEGFLSKEENVIVIEVVGYNVNTYDTLDQPSFLTAEIRLGEQAQAWTGEDGIPVYDLRQRVQDAPRYSFQRAFAEAYTLSRIKGHFYVRDEEEFQREKIEVQPDKTYIYREVWYVLELEKYWERTGDAELIQQAEKRIYALLDYFSGFENELGLLENLEGWVFVEWSGANDKDLVTGVNFPTNMLYARMLQAAGRLYHKSDLRNKAEQLRNVIRKYSFNGRFYTDNMRRDGKTLVNSNVCTEVCQYYAFFTGVADTKRDEALWRILLSEFGPERAVHNTYPEIAFTNTFIGQYLRIELLYQNHCYDEVIKNIKSYFLPMARETGTLWEHKKPTASCNHGFASYVLYWLAGICGIVADIKWLDEAEVFRVGKLPAHSDHLCFLDEAEAEEGNSSFAESLDGSWQFCYSRAPKLRPVDFYREDFDAESFGTIPVPAHIELEGYDHVHYMNKMYPWEGISFRRPADVLEDMPQGCGSFVETDYNPVGSYRKTFDLPERMRGKRIILRFDGVEQAMYVWLNGKFIGYSEDSYTPAEFDLTPYVRDKGNLLCVEVYKWSTAAFLEGQDYFRFFGIFRSVRLLAQPSVHVEDMELRPVLFEDGSTGALRVGLRVSGELQGALTRIRLKDPENHTLAEAVSTLSSKTEVFFEKLAGLRPWSHFTPVLYELQVIVTDVNGEDVEFAVSKLGFRRIDIVGKKLLLNGKRLRICGVNRHEWSGRTGRCICEEDMKRDMQVLKRNHINAVRTSHYPNQVKWYSMCDENGIYVMAETNLESHGSWQKLGETEPSWNIPGCSRVWEKAVLDRAANNYELLKNHPSILFWSLGNEAYAGTALAAMDRYYKEKKDGRLTHYEGVTRNRAYEKEISDLESRMYASPEAAAKYMAENPAKPFILCEYLYGIGNSGGGMKEYMELFDRFDAFAGGFIWSFMDKALIIKDNVTGREVIRCGGEFDDRPSDYSFSADGIMFADGTEKPTMQEVRYFYEKYEA